ncbi:MAG TPA: acyl carrier protein [Gemmatimonadaceae bacterium]|nr:acyl carrier protein [Gemmatimonadaceae bacterium]
MTTVEQDIRTFLAENFSLGRGTTQIPGDQSLTERGFIDSVGIVEVLTFLETQYQIQIDDDETVPENIDTIDNMVRFIGMKRTATGMPARAAGA